MTINWWTEGTRDYYALWIDGEHDHNGEVPEDADAGKWLAEQFPSATIWEVDTTV